MSFAIPQKEFQALAQRLIATFGDLGGVMAADLEMLCRFEGIKRYHAAFTVNRILGRYFGLSLGVMAGKVDLNFVGSHDYKEYDAYAQIASWHPSGLRAGINGVLVKQDLTDRGDNLFGLLNASVGYEFPGKRGLASLEVTNLFNRHFFYQTEFVVKDPFLPARRIMFKLALYL